LHLWLLAKTSLTFAFSLDGKDLPAGKSINVLLDGKPFNAGDKLSLGKHQLAVAFTGGEPLARELRTSYGKNDLGMLPLETSKGSLSVTVNPSPATVVIQQNGQIIHQGDAPLNLDKLPVGDYSLLIRRGEYQETHPAKLERQQLTKANIVLNLGSAELSSDPPDSQFVLSGNGRRWEGQLPIKIDDMPVGAYQFMARRKGWELEESLAVTRAAVISGKVEFQYGSLEIGSEPTGMIVRADGVQIGETPQTLRELKPGQYALTITDGENELNANVAVGAKEAAKHLFTFRYGSVRLSSTPTGASVIRRGKELGKTPLMVPRFIVGETELSLNLAGYVSTNITFDVGEKATTNLNIKLISERYIEAMEKARAAFDSRRFTDAREFLAIALQSNPNDTAASKFLDEISAAEKKAEEVRKQAEERAALTRATPKPVRENNYSGGTPVQGPGSYSGGTSPSNTRTSPSSPRVILQAASKQIKPTAYLTILNKKYIAFGFLGLSKKIAEGETIPVQVDGIVYDIKVSKINTFHSYTLTYQGQSITRSL